MGSDATRPQSATQLKSARFHGYSSQYKRIAFKIFVDTFVDNLSFLSVSPAAAHQTCSCVARFNYSTTAKACVSDPLNCANSTECKARNAKTPVCWSQSGNVGPRESMRWEQVVVSCQSLKIWLSTAGAAIPPIFSSVALIFATRTLFQF